MEKLSTVGITDGQKHFVALVKLAEAGEDVVITRTGRPVARLVAFDRAVGVAAPAQARAVDSEDVPPPEDAPQVVRLRWMLRIAERSVTAAADERTRALAIQQARALSVQISKLSGESRAANPKTGRWERMSPEEIVVELEGMLVDARAACRR